MIPIWKLGGRLGNQMFQLAYLTSQAKRGSIPDIYVQGEEYFDNCKEEVKLMFGQGIGRLDQVAIHVRRGDYVNNNFYVDLMETDYYEKAMAEFPGASFLVFSDNIEWCKDQSIFKDCDFSEGNDEVTDMNLMASCKGIIMANSSFSWWAAYLSKAKVIAPSFDKWYFDGNEDRTTIPSHWKQI